MRYLLFGFFLLFSGQLWAEENLDLSEYIRCDGVAFSEDFNITSPEYFLFPRAAGSNQFLFGLIFDNWSDTDNSYSPNSMSDKEIYICDDKGVCRNQVEDVNTNLTPVFCNADILPGNYLEDKRYYFSYTFNCLQVNKKEKVPKSTRSIYKGAAFCAEEIPNYFSYGKK